MLGGDEVIEAVIRARSNLTSSWPDGFICLRLRRRRKRWKSVTTSSAFTSFGILLLATMVTSIRGHVTLDGELGPHFQSLRSNELQTSFQRALVASLEDDESSSASQRSPQVSDGDAGQDLGDISRVTNSGEADDISRATHFNGSRSSRILKILQVSFERHFKETLLCDQYDLNFISESGSIQLETLILQGCQNLTSLRDLFRGVTSPANFSAVDIDKHRDGLKNLSVSRSINLRIITSHDVIALKSLRRLILPQNGIVEFRLDSILQHLEQLDLSGNPMTSFGGHFLTSFTPNLRQLSLANGSALISVDFFPAALSTTTPSGLLVNLESIILDDNPQLVSVCPWFMRSAPNLISVSMARCPNLEWNPFIFADQRFFPKMEHLTWTDSTFNCDCDVLSSEFTTLHNVSKAFSNENIVDSVRAEVQSRLTCRQGSLSTEIKAFLAIEENCPLDLESGSHLSDPKLTLSWFDPYEEIEEFDFGDNSTENETSTMAPVVTVMDFNQTLSESGVPVWNTVELDCQPETEVDSIFWVTPWNMVFFVKNGTADEVSCQPISPILENACGQISSTLLGEHNVEIFGNGSLIIKDFGYGNRGRYECFIATGNGTSASASIDLVLDDEYRFDIYNLSLIYGFAVAGAFLVLTLTFKLVHFLLHNYGCCLFCCCCENKLPPKARRLKRALDSIEAYRSQQLDKLRENYTQQSEWIRENCASQMERVRENYNTQIQNLKDIRQYGSSQLSAVRGQYYEQMSRIRDYSANQLDRVHENYIFQRQRLRKFSAQNYLKVQETGLYTRRTLGKVMENIPMLYLDLTTCRQGLGDRQPSLEWVEPDQLFDFDAVQGPIYRPSHLFRDQSIEHRSDSIYFTPTGTPMREVFSNGKNTPIKEIDPYKAVYATSSANSTGKKSVAGSGVGHRRNRSLSHFLPPLPTWLSTTSSASALAGNKGLGEINEVEVVIEHETTDNDYYLTNPSEEPLLYNAGKVSAPSPPPLTLSRIPEDKLLQQNSALSKSISVPSINSRGGLGQAYGKHSATSSSGVLSMESNNSPQSQPPDNFNKFCVTTLPMDQSKTLARSTACLPRDGSRGGRVRQKRPSI